MTENKQVVVPVQRTVVFTMGISGSGKSTMARKLYPSFKVIDPDELMRDAPGYDAAHPDQFHAYGAEQAEEVFQQFLGVGVPEFVVDGTGTNSDRMIRRMNEAREHGYTTVLLYVVCPLNECLRRNAMRERKVPEAVIYTKAKEIGTSFNLVAPNADVVKVVNST